VVDVVSACFRGKQARSARCARAARLLQRAVGDAPAEIAADNRPNLNDRLPPETNRHQQRCDGQVDAQGDDVSQTHLLDGFRRHFKYPRFLRVRWCAFLALGQLARVATAAPSITVGDPNAEYAADSGRSGSLNAFRASVPQAGTMQSISIYVSSPAGKAYLGAYDDNAGTPGSLRATTAEFVPVLGWNTVSVPTSVRQSHPFSNQQGANDHASSQ
jgi:hypothetical protein